MGLLSTAGYCRSCDGAIACSGDQEREVWAMYCRDSISQHSGNTLVNVCIVSRGDQKGVAGHAHCELNEVVQAQQSCARPTCRAGSTLLRHSSFRIVSRGSLRPLRGP